MRCDECERRRPARYFAVAWRTVCRACMGRRISSGWATPPKQLAALQPTRRWFKTMVRVRARTRCWYWKGTRDRKGYGVLFIEGKTLGAHRMAYQLWKGPIPPSLVIHHRCERPRCVNPAHLEAVTHLENIAASASPEYRAILLHHQGAQ